MGIVEEGLVLLDRLALVVEDRPASAGPARTDFGPAFDDGAGLRLDLLLNLAAKAVGITQTHLNLESAGRQRVAGLRFAREPGREDRLLGRAIPVHVVHDAGRGLSQKEPGMAQGIGQKILELLWTEIRHES